VIDLRWLERVPESHGPSNAVPVRVLQYRIFSQHYTMNKGWSDWRDVPVVTAS
jgi:hypothetical protein